MPTPSSTPAQATGQPEQPSTSGAATSPAESVSNETHGPAATSTGTTRRAPGARPEAERAIAGTDAGAGDPDGHDDDDADDQAHDAADVTPEAMARLRSQAAGYRRRATAAESERDVLRERLLRLELERVAAPRLARLEDLLVFTDAADLVGADGLPDAEKIAAATDKLLSTRPYLAAPPRRSAGHGDGGSRGTVATPPMTIGGLLQRAARGED